MSDEPPSDCRDLLDAMSQMGRALHALRLEVPAAVADDISARWSRLLDAIGDATDG